jgi:hypothetical protein
VSTPRRRWLRRAGIALAAVVLALVFASYLRPELMVDLGNRLAACF